MANTLLLRLEGPLQAWGERARWDQRDTALEPTKSGVIGLLGCALGMGDDEPLRELSQGLQMGVRCDLPGRLLSDYHTVVGGVLSAEGKVKINAGTRLPETVVSTRYYLADASFVVALRGEEPLLERLAQALQDPVWPPFLGRKTCVPGAPLFVDVGDYATLEAALAAAPPSPRVQVAWAARPPGGVRAVIECSPAEGVRRRDALVSRRFRTFGARYTRDVLLGVPASLPPTAPPNAPSNGPHGASTLATSDQGGA